MAMIKGKVIPKVLEQLQVDGIESALLMSADGALLGTSGALASDRSRGAHVVAAILSNVWAEYDGAQQGPEALQSILMTCEQGRVGSIRIGHKYIAAVCGKTASTKAIKHALQRISASLAPLDSFAAY